MLRLYKGNGDKYYKNIEINKISLVMDNNLWKNCQENLKKCEWYQDGIIHLTPIVNMADELIAYGYQDNEANRELRMLKELRENEDALQFEDVFPEYKEAIICGCNELAVSFAEYLKERKIPVSVIGKYWSYFGYENNYEMDLDGEDKLVIYAEGIMLQNGDLYEAVKRSVSPEFEHIDKIYEVNVLQGKIHNVIGSFDEVIQRLRNEPEIIILGNDKEAQDVYDLLMKHGIDIYGFAVEETKEEEKLLGKYVMSIDNAVKCLARPVFLNYRDTCGALGEEWTEYFDYRGYKRNQQFFLLKDYTEIPHSNLIHVLRGRRVLLTGDQRLCRLLSDYLNSIECGEVTVQYISLTTKVPKGKDDILCLVIPDYHNRLKDVNAKRKSALKQQLSDMGFTDYTEYFINCRSFVLIDLYLSHYNMGKYTIPGITPKGICLGAIPGWSGNSFFRGVMDGHPEILLISYSDLNENLFYYCIRLANVDSDRILSDFWEMYNAEAGSKRIYFKSPKSFEANVKKLLKYKKALHPKNCLCCFILLMQKC